MWNAERGVLAAMVGMSIVIILLVILTVQMYSLSNYVNSLDHRIDSQTHANIQMLEAKINVLEKFMYRQQGRDDVVDQLTPLLKDLQRELEHVRTLQDNP